MTQDHGSRKICLLGDFSVGKTSLIRRYVHSVFNEKYLSTVGVRIDTKSIEFSDGSLIKLVIWDMEGKDQLERIDHVYTRGASGFIFVIDGTRAYTVQTAITLIETLNSTHGEVPKLILINKIDLAENFEVETKDTENLERMCCPILQTSAKTGLNVQQAFSILADMLRTT